MTLISRNVDAAAAAITVSSSVTTFKIPRVFCTHKSAARIRGCDGHRLLRNVRRCAERRGAQSRVRTSPCAYTHATDHGRRRRLLIPRWRWLGNNKDNEAEINAF